MRFFSFKNLKIFKLKSSTCGFQMNGPPCTVESRDGRRPIRAHFATSPPFNSFPRCSNPLQWRRPAANEAEGGRIDFKTFKFDVLLYQSIALDKLCLKSFGLNLILRSVRPPKPRQSRQDGAASVCFVNLRPNACANHDALKRKFVQLVESNRLVTS